VVDQKNPERKFTREDLNARMFITPDPNMETKLPEHINYEDDVLVNVAKEYDFKYIIIIYVRLCNYTSFTNANINYLCKIDIEIILLIFKGFRLFLLMIPKILMKRIKDMLSNY
jgi:hypothetical protein